MGLIVENVEFDGPFTSVQSVQARSGVFLVYDYHKNEGYCRLDVGEADNIHEQLLDHERIDCWEQHSRGTLAYAVYYTNAASRRRVAAKIREVSELPCGSQAGSSGPK